MFGPVALAFDDISHIKNNLYSHSYPAISSYHDLNSDDDRHNLQLARIPLGIPH
jgi:hypothetical protein